MQNKIVRTAAQTAVLMFILTLGSKLIGFIREMVIAGFFGTSYITDAYVMALAIPSIIFAGFFSAVDTAYIPLYSKTVERNGQLAGNRFTSEILTFGLIIALISGILGLLFSDQLVHLCASGFTEEKAELTSFFLKVTCFYSILTSISSLLEAYLRYNNVFLAPILIGYLQNIIVIGVIIASAYYNYYFLAWGWFIAYLIKIFIIWFLAKKNKFKYEFSIKIGSTAKKVLSLSVPVLIGSYVGQINVFVDKALASRLPVGSVAALNYGNLMIGIITGLTVSIVITVIYPKMTQVYSLQNYDYFNKMVSTGFYIILLIAIPFSMGSMLYSKQVIQIVYERGAFDAASTALTATAFFYYSAGILFLSLNQFFTQIYYSMHDMKTPVIYGAFSVIINIVLNLILVRYLALGGLALSTSVAAICNTVLLYKIAKKKYPTVIIVNSRVKIIKIIAASILSVSFSWIVYYSIGNSIWMPRTVLLGVAVLAAAGLYLVILKLFKIEELSLIKSVIKIK